MWPLPRISNKTVHIVLESDSISCYLMHKDGTILSSSTEAIPPIIDGIIYNSKAIEKAIASFIHQHRLQHAFSYVVCAQPLLKEQIITHANSYAQLNDLIDAQPHIYYHYTYIGPTTNQFLFYVCSMQQTLLLQLQLIHHALQLHLQMVASPFSMQYTLYKKVDPTITHTKLIQSIDTDGPSITELYKHETIRNYLKKYNRTEYPDRVLYAFASALGAKE